MTKDINYFQEALEKYKRDKNKYSAFGMEFNYGDDLKDKSNGELMLRHTIIHTCFQKYPNKMKRTDLIKFHDECVNEIISRSLNHKKYDELDGDKIE